MQLNFDEPEMPDLAFDLDVPQFSNSFFIPSITFAFDKGVDR